MDPYAELGVPKDASDAEVKSAFKRRARASHPDRGGKTEEFQRVNSAYQLLSSPERRARYDQTGEETQHPLDEEAQVLNAVGVLIFSIIEAVDVARQDVVDLARGEIKRAIEDAKVSRQKMQKDIAKRERAAKRFTRKSGENRLAQMVEFEIGKMKGAIGSIDKVIELRHAMLKLLDDYRYTVDKDEPIINPIPEISLFTIRTGP